MPEVITNGHSRLLSYWHDLPESERAYFDYDGAKDSYYVKYRNAWYDLAEFMRVDARQQPYLYERGWQAYLTETVFSAIIIRYDTEDNDRVIMGLYM